MFRWLAQLIYSGWRLIPFKHFSLLGAGKIIRLSSGIPSCPSILSLFCSISGGSTRTWLCDWWTSGQAQWLLLSEVYRVPFTHLDHTVTPVFACNYSISSNDWVYSLTRVLSIHRYHRPLPSAHSYANKWWHTKLGAKQPQNAYNLQMNQPGVFGAIMGTYYINNYSRNPRQRTL